MTRPRTQLLLRLAYDGSRFRGVPPQPDLPTVGKAVWERLIDAFGGTPRALTFVARTDAGVHAAENLATCWYRRVDDLDAALERLRADRDDGLLAFDAVEVDMHTFARGLARSKTYRYRLEGGWSAEEIADLRERDLARKHDPALPRLPTHLGRCWQVFPDLDPARMQAAARHLVGTHDFSAFKVGKLGRKSPVRTVTDIRVHALERDGRPHVVVDVTGEGFLRKQVRIMVGTLAECGAGWWAPDDLPRMLHSRDRQLSGQAALARGLCLLSLDVPGSPFTEPWVEPAGAGPVPPARPPHSEPAPG